ncbi:MAG TPA: chorismate lyase [Chryseolinea sp.]|nr:chorismate lyase [Chryseolinea sp.]
MRTELKNRIEEVAREIASQKDVAVETKNKKGFTYTLTSFGKAFINAAAKASKPVMDIGAAYGVATLPALLTGAKVIAVDIEDKHLLSIANSVNGPLKNQLITLKERFPHFDLLPQSLSAVYMSQVLPFLSGAEIEEGIQKIYDWLVPGGEAFVVSFTPYIDHVSSFIPLYEERKRNGIRWAGQIDDLSRFSAHPHIYKNLPNQIHHVDLDDLKWIFEKVGFVVKEARYFGEEEGPLPEGIKMDGRERVGLIAYKPIPEDNHDFGYWQPISSINLNQVPEPVRLWVSEPYVLSKSLRKVCENFAVEVTDQCVKSLYADEVAALKCYDTLQGFVRETYLGNIGNPVVYARVTMPHSTYQFKKSELDNLGNRPIGETLLYRDPTLTRSEFEVKRITCNDELLFDLLVHDNFFKAEIEKIARVNELWARRSFFTISGNPILITEVFLSNIPNYMG